MKNKILPYLLFLSISVLANDTCIEFCGSCMGKSDSPACAKVELLCKCSEMISSLKDEISEVPSDTVTIDSIPADTAFVDTVSADTLQAADSTADTMVVDTIALPAKDSVVKDTVVKDTTTQEAAPDTSLAIIAPTTPQHVELNPEKKERIFYKGVSIGFEQFQEVSVANYDVKKTDEVYNHLGLNLGFFMRWYFYSAGSFQIGLNGIWHHGRYALDGSNFDARWYVLYYHHDVSIDYHNIMAEIPLTVRIGLPFKFSPYISLSAHIRKPIYAWVEYDANISWSIDDNYYDPWSYHFGDFNSSDGAYTADDWEFIGFVGAGLEILRHVSIQWQVVCINAVTYSNEHINYRLGESWRLSLDFAW